MKKSFSELRQLIVEAETTKEKLILEKLPYDRNDLTPILSKNNLDIHYGILAKTYVDRFNNNEGDDRFNKAGALLHNIFFAQFQKPLGSNKPSGASLELINRHYKDFNSFKDEVLKSAMAIQGSGWVYLAHNGKIKTIKNHEIFQDILLLIDWWEHSWFLDYGHDKKKYLTSLWRIIDWAVINDRINLTNKN
jgi:Fe-Mn family superoxide dismutase